MPAGQIAGRIAAADGAIVLDGNGGALGVIFNIIDSNCYLSHTKVLDRTIVGDNQRGLGGIAADSQAGNRIAGAVQRAIERLNRGEFPFQFNVIRQHKMRICIAIRQLLQICLAGDLVRRFRSALTCQRHRACCIGRCLCVCAVFLLLCRCFAVGRLLIIRRGTLFHRCITGSGALFV